MSLSYHSIDQLSVYYLNEFAKKHKILYSDLEDIYLDCIERNYPSLHGEDHNEEVEDFEDQVSELKSEAEELSGEIERLQDELNESNRELEEYKHISQEEKDNLFKKGYIEGYMRGEEWEPPTRYLSEIKEEELKIRELKFPLKNKT